MGDETPGGSLQDLDARLKRARSQEQSRSQGRSSVLRTPMSGFGVAFRIGVELVAALVVGVGAGLLLDRWLGTTPWFLIVFFFLGAAAGVLNVYRAASGIGLAEAEGAPAPSDGEPEEQDDDWPGGTGSDRP
ncbi:MAG: AtpZ/AtpI family protein [Rhodospirillales bacterium]|nr:AtpZ/AtpI family protein [Rhodospirillales bacterium]